MTIEEKAKQLIKKLHITKENILELSSNLNNDLPYGEILTILRDNGIPKTTGALLADEIMRILDIKNERPKSRVFSYKNIFVTASSKKEAIQKIISSNILKELNFPKTEDQEIIFLNSLVNARGKDSEKIFTEVDIKRLSKLLKKYPKYKDKIPTKLIRLIKRNSLIA